MDILGGIITGDSTVLETGGDDRNLPLEGDKALENERHAAERCKGTREVFAAPEETLALAVITHATGLQYALAAESGQSSFQLFLTVHCTKIGGRDATAVEEAFFRQPVLRGAERLRRWIDGNGEAELFGGRDRHVFKFVGHDIAAVCEFRKRFFVIIFRDDLVVADLRSRAIGLRFQHDGSVVETGSGHRQHAPELPAADDADGQVGRLCHHFCRHWALSMGYSATAADWRARQASSRSARSSSLSARTAAARRAALIAPALPMASVPTGMPAGICTME
ncbi:hypothetical protein D3C86_1217280 [compost metagenome]